MRRRPLTTRLLGGLAAVTVGLLSLWVATTVTRAFARASGLPLLSFALWIVLVVATCLAASVFLRPRPGDAFLMFASLTLILWATVRPSGEASPSDRAMDASARAGWAFAALVLTVMWSGGVALARYVRITLAPDRSGAEE